MSNVDILDEIWQTICSRMENPPEKSYVVQILTHRKGMDKALEKVGEEATEFIIAAKNDEYDKTVGEAADLLFHTILALKAAHIEFDDVLKELIKRHQE